MYEITVRGDSLTEVKQQLITLVENLGAREEVDDSPTLFEETTQPDSETQIPPELDKDGLPWDERIHSSNKQLTQEGFWRKRRGVTEDLVNKVESELRGTPPVPPPPPVTEPENPMGPFIAFVGRTMAAIGEKKLTQAQVDQVCQKYEVSSMAALGQRMDLIPVIQSELFK